VDDEATVIFTSEAESHKQESSLTPAKLKIVSQLKANDALGRIVFALSESPLKTTLIKRPSSLKHADDNAGGAILNSAVAVGLRVGCPVGCDDGSVDGVEDGCPEGI